MYNTQHCFICCGHCNKNPIYVFPEKELHGLSPNFHIHVSVSDLYIPTIGPHIFLQQNRLTDIWLWKLGLSPPFLGIFVSNFRYCVFTMENTGIEPKAVAMLALTARCSHHLARSHSHCEWRASGNPIKMSGSHLCIPINETFISKTELKCSVSQLLHSYICERYIFFQDRSVYSAAGKYMDQSGEYTNRSQTHEYGNWDCGRAISRKGINGIFFAVHAVIILKKQLLFNRCDMWRFAWEAACLGRVGGRVWLTGDSWWWLRRANPPWMRSSGSPPLCHTCSNSGGGSFRRALYCSQLNPLSGVAVQARQST